MASARTAAGSDRGELSAWRLDNEAVGSNHEVQSKGGLSVIRYSLFVVRMSAKYSCQC